MKWSKKLTTDLMEISLIRRLVKLHYFQFLFVAPLLVISTIATIAVIYGVENPALNFGMVFFWMIWWGLLILLFVLVGRGWCFMCPIGVFGDWIQRLSPWWKSKWSLGFNKKYPPKHRNLWLALVLFLIFIFLDYGYGISNSPSLTAALIIAIVVGAIGVAIVFEKRTFCLYLCPVTLFIGVSSMFAPFEIRKKKAEVCRKCQTKDCFRGNERFYGCPVLEFPGGDMDTNRDCILCTECIKACPHDNIGMRFRRWGHDLWARKKARLDESVGAVTISGVVTVVALFLVLFLPQVNIFTREFWPSAPPADWPRLVSVFLFYLGRTADWPRIVGIGALYLGALAATLLFMYSFSYLSKLFSGAKDISTNAFFVHFGYAVLPLGVMKFLSDILDHVLRTWGMLANAISALFLDFPLNRVDIEEPIVNQVLSANQTYLLQLALITFGLGFSLYVAYKLAGRMFSNSDIAFRAFLPIGAFIAILAMTALWTLSAAL